MQINLAKIRVSHIDITKALGLPEDVVVTSTYTDRPSNRGVRSDYSWVYVKCPRFDMIEEGMVAPEISMNDIINKGLWNDDENNE